VGLLELMVPKQDTFQSTDAGNYETYIENISIDQFYLRELCNFTHFHIKSMLVCTKASNPNYRRNNLQNMISGFCCEVDEIFVLGNYAAYSGNSLSTVWDNPSVPTILFLRFLNP
jgi:hypothetical protein